MIKTLALYAQEHGSQPMFYTQLESGTMRLSYRQARLASAALARGLIRQGYQAGTYLAINSYNCAEFVIMALASAYAGFSLVVLNPRLSDEERNVRMMELETATHQKDIPVVTEQALKNALVESLGMELLELSRLGDGQIPINSYTMGILDFAQEREEAYNSSSCGVIMFTSGTSGTPKAAKLLWEDLMGAAVAANERLLVPRKGMWQLVLPLCHVGGLEVMVRCLLNGNPFILYKRYSVQGILNDVLTFNVTHISVVDKILRDLLENDKDKIISQYKCILLGGSALNDKTIKRALRAKARVYASYGMTETSSMIACSRVTRSFDGGLELLQGYRVNIMRPDEKGIGALHVKGPGVFAGYLNARAAFTLDEWFVTGDRAMIDHEGFLHVFERVHDLIVSGGENIYPEEIREELLRIPGVKDAFVFGTADEEWGYRPVAFIEADYSTEAIERDHKDSWLYPEDTGIKPASCPQEFARNIHAYLDERMSSLHHPKHILVLNEFPRTVANKVNTQELRQLYDRRIDIKSVSLYRVRQNFAHPVTTAKGIVDQRESFFVEIRDWAGRTGIGECVSFTTNWYLPETLEDDYVVVRDDIAEIVMNERYLHPSEVSRSLATFPDIADFPQAKSAVECAVWDLYGKVVAKPLRALLGGAPLERVLGGTVVGIMDTDETLAAVDAAVAQGYERVKIKIEPNSAVDKVRAVRERYPNLTIFLDANQSFNESQLDALYKLDRLNIACLEEPLDPSYIPQSGQRSLFDRLSTLQETLTTPICLDESVVSAQEMMESLEYDNLRCYAVKISKFGGIQPSLDFINFAEEQGFQVWMGGMFDTGVSKRTYAAFETLAGVDLPGDIADYSEYFDHDCARPALECAGGELLLNPKGYETGIGCSLDKDYLDEIMIDSVTLSK